MTNKKSLVLFITFTSILVVPLISTKVHAQSLNTCKQIFTNYGSSIVGQGNDGKVNILDCVFSFLPQSSPTPTPDPETLESEIESLNTQLLQLASTGNTNQMLTVAQQRKDKLLYLIPQNPGAAYDLMFTEGEMDEYRSTLGENLEDEIDITGTLNVTIADDFENGTSQTFYELILDDQVLGTNNLPLTANNPNGQVLSAATPASFQIYSGQPMPEVLSNSQVQVVGMQLAEFLVLGSLSGQGQANVLQAAEVPSTGNKKVLIMPINFSDNPHNKPYDPNTLQSLIAQKMSPYFEEVSYQKTTIEEVTVLPWITLQIPTSVVCTTQMDTPIQLAMDANDNLINYLTYDQVGTIFIAIPNLQTYCNGFKYAEGSYGYTTFTTPDGLITAGSGYISLTDNDDNTNLFVLFHEFGHTLGSWHASSYNPNATENDYHLYSDLFDLMKPSAINSSLWHINAGLRETVSWLKVQPNCHPGPIGHFHGECIQEVTAPGVYYIKPIELPFAETPTNPIRAVKISPPDQWQIIIEYRQPIGFDDIPTGSPNVFNGASIRLISPTAVLGSRTFLFDTTPGSNPSDPTFDFDDAQLTPGNSINIFNQSIEVCSATQFNDVQYNATLTVAINTTCPGTTEKFGNVMPVVFKNYQPQDNL